MITMLQFAPGEAILKEGDHGECAYVIERGRVEIRKSQDGKATHIAFLGQGATFGEMSLVDDQPRSASVLAVEETLVREIHRDDLLAAMKSNPDSVIHLLKNLFERLREANVQIARQESLLLGAGCQLVPASSETPIRAAVTNSTATAQSPAPAPSATNPFQPGAKLPFGGLEGRLPSAEPVKAAFVLEGLTDKAKSTLSNRPMPLLAFPFKIGRSSSDPMAHNHLSIDDQAPLQISRHHVSIILEGERIGISDRGSQLGARVDGVRIGGHSGPGPIFLKNGEGTLVLGNDKSEYRYKIRPV